MQSGEVGIVNFMAVQTHLHRKVEHGALAGRDIRFAVVHRHLVSHQRFLFIDAQNRAVRHHAIQTVVGRAGGGHDHLAVALGEVAVLFEHQRVVIVEKRAPFGGASCQRQKHIGHEARFFLHFQNLGAHVLGQILEVGVGVAAHVCLHSGHLRLCSMSLQ